MRLGRGGCFNPQVRRYIYYIRWSVKVSIRHLKLNGFRLEDMSLERRTKREMMMAIQNLVFVMCVIEGRKFFPSQTKEPMVKFDHTTGKTTLFMSSFDRGFAKF